MIPQTYSVREKSGVYNYFFFEVGFAVVGFFAPPDFVDAAFFGVAAFETTFLVLISSLLNNIDTTNVVCAKALTTITHSVLNTCKTFLCQSILVQYQQ